MLRIQYQGQLKDSKHNTRCAIICFDNEKDGKIAERIVDLAEKVTYWKDISGFDECYYIGVDDRKDYEDFVEFYKSAKKTFKQCEKYGF